jgi:hypothetical protein
LQGDSRRFAGGGYMYSTPYLQQGGGRQYGGHDFVQVLLIDCTPGASLVQCGACCWHTTVHMCCSPTPAAAAAMVRSACVCAAKAGSSAGFLRPPAACLKGFDALGNECASRIKHNSQLEEVLSALTSTHACCSAVAQALSQQLLLQWCSEGQPGDSPRS